MSRKWVWINGFCVLFLWRTAKHKLLVSAPTSHARKSLKIPCRGSSIAFTYEAATVWFIGKWEVYSHCDETATNFPHQTKKTCFKQRMHWAAATVLHVYSSYIHKGCRGALEWWLTLLMCVCSCRYCGEQPFFVAFHAARLKLKLGGSGPFFQMHHPSANTTRASRVNWRRVLNDVWSNR